VKINQDILKELQEIAPALATLDKVNFYQVEVDYFDHVPANIVEMIGHEIRTEGVPEALNAVRYTDLYPAPQPFYFESFSDLILTKINVEEAAEELAYTLPILQHTEKKELYTVPAAYFDSFPESVIKLTKQEASIHPSPIRQWRSKWSTLTQAIQDLILRPRYAFAMASAVGMIVFAVLVINSQPNMSGDDKIFAQMQQIPDADLHHYISRHRDEFDEHTILTNINNVDLTHYFEKSGQPVHGAPGQTNKGLDEEIANEDVLD
jgi:hypothetical protein